MSLPSDPAARKAIKKYMDELSASMARIDGERDFIKEAINNCCEEYEMNKRTFRKLAKVYHKQNFSKEVAEHEEFETMYEQLTGETSLGDIK
jgi:Transcriptional regulator DsbA